MNDDRQFPKLREVEIHPLVHNGRPCLLLRDPLQLTPKTIVIPQQVAPALALCDGTRQDAGALSAALAVRYGLRLAPGVVEQLLKALDDALMLDNDRFAQAKGQAVDEYRSAPCRRSSLAGQSYPARADELRALLDHYIESARDIEIAPVGATLGGLVSPHIDYERGGPVYARVWKRAAERAKAADLAVVLGTDHHGEHLLTLTRQHYATPYGTLPTARDVVDVLGEAIGPEQAFAGELNHRSEHSIELAAIWLHHLRAGQPCELVPILCGSFSAFVENNTDPEQHPILHALLATLPQAAAGRNVIVIAAGDLAHVGPAFGGTPLDLSERRQLASADNELIERMCAGDAPGFLDAIRRVGDGNNVCGVPPIYLALRLMGPVQGELVAYDRCPADNDGTSVVTVCGINFSSSQH